MIALKQSKGKTVIAFSWIIMLLWMIIIFLSSAQPAQVSGANSKGIVVKLVVAAERMKLITDGISEDIGLMSVLDHYFRKATHAVVYFILALLVLNAFYRSGLKGKKLYILSFAICALYAGSDELHQLFVPGRGGQLRDVMIDCTGAALGLGVRKMLLLIRQ